MKSEVLDLNDSDINNFKRVHRTVGAAALLPDDISRLYEIHYSAMAAHFLDGPSQIAGVLYVACRKHLLLATLSLFRLYSSQAFRETRAAIETAGIAHNIRVDSESFRIFREDKGDGPSHEAARKHFISSRLFPANVPKLAKLKRLYDKASALSHSNRRTFAPHLDVRKQTFSFHDIRPKEVPNLVTNHLLWICAAHLRVLEAADVVFADVKADLAMFQKERKELGQRLERFIDKDEGRTVE